MSPLGTAGVGTFATLDAGAAGVGAADAAPDAVGWTGTTVELGGLEAFLSHAVALEARPSATSATRFLEWLVMSWETPALPKYERNPSNAHVARATMCALADGLVSRLHCAQRGSTRRPMKRTVFVA